MATNFKWTGNKFQLVYIQSSTFIQTIPFYEILQITLHFLISLFSIEKRTIFNFFSLDGDECWIDFFFQGSCIIAYWIDAEFIRKPFFFWMENVIFWNDFEIKYLVEFPCGK